MGTDEDAKRRAAATYNAASDNYDDPANTFWERFGRRTVERLGLSKGARVLDVCCGSGASALPAAEAVGPGGEVLGVDLAEGMLELARMKAARRGLRNIEFRVGDMLDLGLPGASFDAVVCVFGIFFVPDMQAAVRELWRLVRPGGKLAVTTWGQRVFEPADAAFWESVRAIRPELYKGFNPWDRIAEPEAVRTLFDAAGVEDCEAVAEEGTHPINSPEGWWAIILGSGYRGTVESLSAEERERVRLENLDFIRRERVRSVGADVVYASAVKGQTSTSGSLR